MKFLILLLFLAAAHAEQLEGLLNAVPTDLLSGLMHNSKPLDSEDKTASGKLPVKPLSLVPPMPVGAPITGTGKMLKAAAAVIPFKTVAVKKAVAAKVLAAPKLKAIPMAVALKSKPKVHKLKPIVYIIEKPVPVYHKVPVPKKILVPKFYPVFKKIPVPKIVPVPFKVPIKKIIPKIVKIPKAIPVPKIVFVKKPVPIGIPYPVPKFYKVPIMKPVPYAKYIPIPVPKKVPKFIPVPIKKIIKVPKPYYVPIKVPHFTASYIKTPMAVNVPNIKKVPYGGKFTGGYYGGKSEGLKPSMKLPRFNEGLKFSEYGSDTGKDGKSLFSGPLSSLGVEDKELLKLLSNGMPGGKNIKI